MTLLQETFAYSEGSDAEKSSDQLEQIVQTALTEAQIESLIIAKGYTDCVAYMTSEGISIAVSAPEGGLQEADVAVIADIGISQSEYLLSDIRIVEVQCSAPRRFPGHFSFRMPHHNSVPPDESQ